MNDENLIPITSRSPRERKEIAKKGAKASNEARKRRKTLREELTALLEIGDTQKKVSTALLDKAVNGDVKAFETIRDTIGEKPTEKQEIEYGENTLATITAGMSLDDKQKAIKELVDDLKPGGSE